MRGRLIETVMGAVVLVIAVVFMVFAYNAADLRPVDGYRLTAQFASVGGLAPGNDVRIGGVRVGTVVDQTIEPERFRAVVTFTIRHDLRLPVDTRAAIASDGLLGGKYLRLEVGRETARIEPGGEIRETSDALALEELLSRAIFLLSEEPKKE